MLQQLTILIFTAMMLNGCLPKNTHKDRRTKTEASSSQDAILEVPQDVLVDSTDNKAPEDTKAKDPIEIKKIYVAEDRKGAVDQLVGQNAKPLMVQSSNQRRIVRI